MYRIILLLLLSIATSLSHAALESRLGGQAFYDPDADLTWLADANANGQMNWASANAWAAAIDIDGDVGPDGWRLPNTVDVGNDGATYTSVYRGVDYGYNITTHSEMSNMFYNVLGNTPYYYPNGIPTGCASAPNYCLSNTGPFSNLQSSNYWSATGYAPNTDFAWQFSTRFGTQDYYDKPATNYAWAVYEGDVSAVPIPAAVWLFGSGLLGLVGVVRRRKS